MSPHPHSLLLPDFSISVNCDFILLVAQAPKIRESFLTPPFLSTSHIHLINKSCWLCLKYIQNLMLTIFTTVTPGLSYHWPLNWPSCFLPCLPTDYFQHSSESDAVNRKSDSVTPLFPISFKVLVLVYKTVWFSPAYFFKPSLALHPLIQSLISEWVSPSHSSQTTLFKINPFPSTICSWHYLRPFSILFFFVALTIIWHWLSHLLCVATFLFVHSLVPGAVPGI